MSPTPTPDLTFTEYQQGTVDTAIYPDAGQGTPTALVYCALGVSNEAGELAGVIKKMLRDGTSSDQVAKLVFKESGDVLYYLARVLDELGLTLADVANGNRAKLLDRQARGVLGGSGDNR